jgi:hypothetical protein
VSDTSDPDPLEGYPDLQADRDERLRRAGVARDSSQSRNGAHEPPGREPGDDSDDTVVDAAAVRSGYRFDAIDSKTFAETIAAPQWLVKNLLVEGQPGIWGGPKKALKTSLLVDLVLSLGTGTPFLGTFPTSRPVRVAFLSGESGRWTVRETAVRVARARGIDLASARVLWGFTLPQLANPVDLDELRRGLEEHLVQVLVIDPVYLALLAGQTNLDARNLFEMGPLLLNIAQTCLSAGSTPILCHHTRKNVASPHEPGDLEDLAYGGFQEFCRQWVLITRREPYEPGSGQHALWLSAGGSVGHGGCWAIDVSEGQLADDFTGRGWEVTVTAPRDARQRAAEEGEAKKHEAKEAKDLADDLLVLKVVERLMSAKPAARADAGDKQAPPVAPQAPTKNLIQQHAGISGGRVARSVGRLVDRGQLEEVEVTVQRGTGGKVKSTARGYRRNPWGPSTNPTSPTQRELSG